MIEFLDGMTETIRYEHSPEVKLYHNVDFEDFPEHWHTGIEIIMPVLSEYTVILGTGQTLCRLLPGDILMINSGELHALMAPPEGERLILQFDPSLLCVMKELETLMALLPGHLWITQEREPELYGPVKRQMDRIAEEYDEDKIFSGAAVYAALIEMFVEIGRTVTGRKLAASGESGSGSSRKRGGYYLEAVMKACGYINSHYQEKLTLENTAAIVGFSKFHFSRLFKQYMNMTFCDYVNKKRVQCVEKLLQFTDMNMTDIAMKAGFSSVSAFDRTFKSVNHCSPSDFRTAARDGRGLQPGAVDSRQQAE